MRALSAVLLVLAAVLAGCGGAAGGAEGDGRLEVVATTTQVADLAAQVAGDRAAVRGLLTPNADPHEYELKPSDLDALTGAGLVLRSGGEVDGWLTEAVRDAGVEAPVVDLAERVAPVSEDPHWWQDPRAAIAAVRTIAAALSRADPAGASTYRAAAGRSVARLDRLDRAVARCLAAIPADRRKLVTTHDALGAFARRYGLEVIGAVIPARSTRAQASAGETAALVATIRRERVRAVFAETAVSSDVERAVARESGARIGAPLYADALGPRGSPGATYAGSIAANARAIAEGLTGGRAPCSLPRE